jgi:NADH:ubiquinone oxidoreductase subunit 6 (subunit J)
LSPNLNPTPNVPIILLLFILLLVSFIHFSRNIIHVVILLLFIYIVTGILFIRLGFDFLGYMILIIYAGAIIILFIFVLMLIEMKNFKNKMELTNKFIYFSYIIILFLILNIFIYNFSYFSIVVDFNNFNKFQNMYALKLVLVFQFFNKTTNLVEMSPLVKTAYILFSLSWFETILIGFILLLALVFIIYLFKK